MAENGFHPIVARSPPPAEAGAPAVRVSESATEGAFGGHPLAGKNRGKSGDDKIPQTVYHHGGAIYPRKGGIAYEQTQNPR